MRLNRRKFLQIASYGIGGAIAGISGISLLSRLKQSPPVDSATLSQTIQDAMQPDFQVLEKVSREDASSLDKLLNIDEKYAPHLSRRITITLEKFPSFIYTYTIMDRQRGSGGAESISIANYCPGGSAFVFSQRGYLLTTFHQVDPIFNTPGSKGGILVFYDPTTGLSSSVRLLAYSQNYDLALGRIRAPDGMYRDTPILTAEPVYPEIVYSALFGNLPLLFDKQVEVCETVIGSGERYKVDASLKFSIEELKMGISAGELTNGLSGENEVVKQVKAGTRAYFQQRWTQYDTGERVGISPGNSGSPVFTYSNQLIGTVTEILGTKKSADEIDTRIVTFAGPSVVRALLKHYVNACNSG